jgi:hypothetical protein
VSRRVFIRALPLVALLAGMAILAARAGPAPQASPAAAAAAPTTKPADNSYCYTCHLNFDEEPLAHTHMLAGVGCARCHGESDNHSSDENGITPPDVMFPRREITRFCLECHRKEDLLDDTRRPKNRENHAPTLSGTSPAAKRCTECHGEHTMPVRTRRWDKRTGKLIEDDGVRVVE